MLINDSEGHIENHIKADKNFFRVDKMLCSKCHTQNQMLDSCEIDGPTVFFHTNCFECGHNDKFKCDEKTLLRQMFEIEFTKKPCLYFRAFRVCWAYDYFVDGKSKSEAGQMILTLMKKYKHRRLWYFIRYLGNKK